MIQKPFTKEEASSLTDKFNHLLLRDFTVEDRMFAIVSITLVPYEQSRRLEVLKMYSMVMNNVPGHSLDGIREYTLLNSNSEFDVALIAFTFENGGKSVQIIPIQLISSGNEMEYGFTVVS